jgi:L-fuconolactonase
MIDAHVHVWTLDAERYPWQQTLAHVPIPSAPATAEDLMAEMTASGVRQAVLVQPSVYGWSNAYLCDCLERFPGRFAGVCLVDPSSPRNGADLRHWVVQRGCSGVRINLIAEQNPAWGLEAGPGRILAAAAELGIAVELQTHPTHVDTIVELARRYPSITMIVDYLGADAFRTRAAIEAVRRIAEVPSTAFKLLSLSQDSHEAYPFGDLVPLLQAAAKSFGTERLVLGTDFPHVRLRSSYAESIGWLSGLPFLPPSAEARIDDTARAFFALEPPEETP